jgi:serine/threonine protein kinase
MSQLPASRYERLLEILDHDDFVRGALSELEFDFRGGALVALAEWERLDVAASELFRAVASLQRPSWGHWNGVVGALRASRRGVLRTGDAESRERVRGATRLSSVLDLWDTPVPAEVDVSALARLANSRESRPTIGSVLALPITVRNRVAHAPPSDWTEFAGALRPLVVALAERRLEFPSVPDELSPWIVNHEGEPWLFAGVDDRFQVMHQSRSGKLRESASLSQAFVESLQRLLGKEKVRDTNFQRWLTQYATDDIKGVMLGDYLVGRPVGEGGFATVHRAVQLGTGRRVAVKILRDELRTSMGARFQREAEYLARINHRGVVSVVEHGEEPWIAPRGVDLSGEEWYRAFSKSAPVKSFFAMEWIEGRTLEQVFLESPRPDRRTLCRWMADLADALASVHSAGLIHRDVKPSNIMITDENRVVLADFGIARPREDARTLKTTAGHVLGTPAYMSPEQIRAANAEDAVGPEADLYALCATFYELFTGTRLFRHDTESAVSVETRKLAGERPEPPGRVVTGLPWEIDTILMGGLEPEISDRYRSARDLERDLRHVLQDQPIEYRRPSFWRRSELFYRRHRWTTNLAGLTLLILVVAAVVSTLFGLEARRQAVYAIEQEGLAKSQTRLAEENALLSEWGEFQAEREKERAVAARELANTRYGLAVDSLGKLVFEVQTELGTKPQLAALQKRVLGVAAAGLKTLAEKGEGVKGTLRDRTEAYGILKLGDILQTLDGKAEEAAKAFIAAHETFERLAEEAPGDAQAQRDVSTSYERLGMVTEQLGQAKEALLLNQKMRGIKSLSDYPGGSPGDEGELKMDEGEVIVGLLFPADEESSRAVGPRMVALNDPTASAGVASMRPLRVLAFAGDVHDVTASLCRLTNGLRVVPFVGTEMLPTTPGRPRSTDRKALQRVADERLVMPVGSVDRHSQRDAATVRQHRAFHTELAPIGRVLPRFFPRPTEPSSSRRPNFAIPSRCRPDRRTLPGRVATADETRRGEPTPGSTHESHCPSRTPEASPSIGNPSAARTKFPPRPAASPAADDHPYNSLCKKGAPVRCVPTARRESGETLTKHSPP